MSTKNLFRLFDVADFDAASHVDDSLVQIWKLKFVHKTKFLFRL